MALSLAAAAAAQELLAVLEASFVVEARLLDADLARYARARVQEGEARRRLEAEERTLDAALEDQAVPVEELRRAEERLAAARETAYARSREVAELRRQLYGRMERLEELGSQIERQRNRELVETARLDGLWRLEISPDSEFGLANLRQRGTEVSGTYRLSNGDQGSLRGTLVERRIVLERVDARRGFDATLDGEFDQETGEITGQWTAVDVTGGRPGGGTWSARKLSPAEEEGLGLR